MASCASIKIHCGVNKTITFKEGEIMSVKDLLEYFRRGSGFSGGYFYANEVCCLIMKKY
jgi:hypothetical protein